MKDERFVLLPKLGNSVESCIIVSWLKQVGDAVAEGEPICAVETDKTTMEVTSTTAGTLLNQLVKTGDDVPVMTPIAEVGSSVSPNTQTSNAQTTNAASISPRARALAGANSIPVNSIVGSGPAGRIIERDVQAVLSIQANPIPPRITPLAQRIAQEHNINIADVKGTGPNGQITRDDIEQAEHMERGAWSVRREAMTPAPRSTPHALTPTRKVIAKRMHASLLNSAQLTMTASADARNLQRYRHQLKNSDATLALQTVTLNDLVLFAVAHTLPQFPELNATFGEGVLMQFATVQLGFAVDTPRGLLVPVIPQAETLSLRQLASQARMLAAQARAGTLLPDHLRGGSFTISNLGQFGIETFTPILNPPQVAILGVGGIDLKAILVNDHVEHIPHLHLSLTIDHQVVDGAPAARFLQALCRNLAQFELLLAL